MSTQGRQADLATNGKPGRRPPRCLPRQMLRRAALSLAAATGPAIVALVNWWIHTH